MYSSVWGRIRRDKFFQNRTLQDSFPEEVRFQFCCHLRNGSSLGRNFLQDSFRGCSSAAQRIRSGRNVPKDKAWRLEDEGLPTRSSVFLPRLSTNNPEGIFRIWCRFGPLGLPDEKMHCTQEVKVTDPFHNVSAHIIQSPCTWFLEATFGAIQSRFTVFSSNQATNVDFLSQFAVITINVSSLGSVFPFWLAGQALAGRTVLLALCRQHRLQAGQENSVKPSMPALTFFKEDNQCCHLVFIHKKGLMNTRWSGCSSERPPRFPITNSPSGIGPSPLVEAEEAVDLPNSAKSCWKIPSDFAQKMVGFLFHDHFYIEGDFDTSILR